MTKFDNRLTETLYGLTPVDETGQSNDGHSWYGLYPAQSGGHILVEDTYGNVSRVTYATSAALYLAWSEIETDPGLSHSEGTRLGEWRDELTYYGVAI